MWHPDSHRSARCGSLNIAVRRIARGLRYPSDLTDAEWALIEPMIPPAKRGGRRREVNVREVLNAIFYVLSTGCQWQALPKDLPPKSTAHYYFMLWDWDGTLERIHHALYVADARAGGARGEPDGGDHRQPERQGRSKRGSALDPQGFDAGKKVTGRKRHILVDTLGLLLNVVVHPADVQDRDGARRCSTRTRRLFPFIERIFADAGYQGPKMAKAAAKTGRWTSRSSSATMPIASSSCPSAGSSSAPSHGSATTAASRATSSATPEPSPPSSASP